MLVINCFLNIIGTIMGNSIRVVAQLGKFWGDHQTDLVVPIWYLEYYSVFLFAINHVFLCLYFIFLTPVFMVFFV